MMMNEMLALLPAGARADDTLFLALFLLRLPVSMRDHLAAADHKTARTWLGRPTPGPSDGGKSLCYYHSRFGQKAHRCEAPCTWAEN
jgi:hypothetical protein